VDDLLTRPAWRAGTAAAAASGVRSAWAAPIVGSDGVLGTVSGYAAAPGNPAPERLELATIYLRYAASAIERERLLTEVSRRNRVLESLRGLLESLAGPERVQGGREISLLALLDGLQRDWCELPLVVGAAAHCLSGRPAPRIHVEPGVEPVWADHDRLEQVFVNLLENAASHGASRRGTDVTVRAGPGGAVVEVTDYGAGIPPGLAEKIFEPRIRGTTEVAGTGLGLPIARGIVEAHGGTLASAPAAPGASFVVTLPADPPPGSIAEPTGASWNVVEEPEEQRGG